MNNLEWALACAARGWLVFPSIGKKPLVKWGTMSTTDTDTITRWWSLDPHADVCIKTGEASGLVVIDWDKYKIASPLAQFPLEPYPFTYSCETPKGGFHFYFAHPGYPVANSAGTLAEYVDVRGDGGMVVAYPPYDDRDLAPIPEAWATKRNTVTVQMAPIAEPYAGDGDGLTLAVDMLESYADEVLAAPEGTLNTTLWRRSADAFKMVAAGELREQAVLDLMHAVAVAAGHPSEGAAQTIASARNRGMLEPTGCVDMFWRSKGR